MDRLAQLALDLSNTLEELRGEAHRRNLPELIVPLAWLEEANCWLKYELARGHGAAERDPVPFTYIPADLRK